MMLFDDMHEGDLVVVDEGWYQSPNIMVTNAIIVIIDVGIDISERTYTTHRLLTCHGLVDVHLWYLTKLVGFNRL